MRAVVVSLLALCGCDALFNLDHVPDRGDGGTVGDGNGDADDTDADTQNICFGTGRGFHAKFCYPVGTPIPAPMILTSIFDTDASCPEVVAQANGSAVCIVKAESISISSSLRVIGSRPLVLLSQGQLGVNGVINGSSTFGGTKGAGANTSSTFNSCANTVINGHPGGASTGGGGGAGGSFRNAGGNGGNGDGGFGGIARPADDPIVIRGGCMGGNGGPGSGFGGSTPGAAGGGAIYLASSLSIVVSGTITVNGAGGEGGTINFGGAGGGGGGMIVLDAPTVTVGTGSQLLAVGGGGGQGGGKTSIGDNGQDGPIGAGGANQNVSGGTGGSGSQDSGNNGAAGSGGGGGGGGGGGYIAVASPNPTVEPTGSYRPQPLIQ